MYFELSLDTAAAQGLHQNFRMSNGQRSLQVIQDDLRATKNPQFYDHWAATYNSDLSVMQYKGPEVTADLLKKHLTLSPDQVRVLDVACGTGLIAEKLSTLGFRQFVGVDASKAMLDKARQTGLYQELHQAKLGTQPLPVDSGAFDVVTVIGFLHRKYVPVEFIREACQTAKPGGLVLMNQAEYQTPDEQSFIEDLHREQRRMEEEGLWKQLEAQLVEEYMIHPYKTEDWVRGWSYIFQKTL